MKTKVYRLKTNKEIGAGDTISGRGGGLSFIIRTVGTIILEKG